MQQRPHPGSHLGRLGLRRRQHHDLHRRPVRPGAGRCVLLPGRREHRGAGPHDLRRAAVVGIQPHDRDAGEVLLHPAEHRRVGAVPAVDGLPWVAHQAEVRPVAQEGLQQAVLQRVEVLCLVDEQMAEAPADGRGPRIVGLHRGQHVVQQVVEVHHAAAALQPGVRLRELGERTGRQRAPTPCRTRLTLVVLRHHDAGAGPVQVRQRAAGLHPQPGLGEDLLGQAQAVLCHLRRGAVCRGGPVAQQAQRHRVERARLDALAQVQPAEAAHQLAGRIAGEREGQDMRRVGRTGGDAVGDPPGEDGGLAGPRGGHHGQRRGRGSDGLALRRVQPRQQVATGLRGGRGHGRHHRGRV